LPAQPGIFRSSPLDLLRTAKAGAGLGAGRGSTVLPLLWSLGVAPWVQLIHLHRAATAEIHVLEGIFDLRPLQKTHYGDLVK
jgi:hypothetical protein